MNYIYNFYAWLKEDDYKTLDLDSFYQDTRSKLSKSIEDYKYYSDMFLIDDILKMDQQIKVNGASVGTGDIDDSKIEGDVSVCPNNKKLRIVHCFESSEFIPIPNSSFKIIAVKLSVHNGSDHTSMKPKYEEDTSVTPFSGQVGKNGEADVTLPDDFSGKKIRIVFYPDVTQSDINALMDSYNSVVDSVLLWLDKCWETQKTEWEAFIEKGMSISESRSGQNQLINNELIKIWDEIKTLYEVISNPEHYIKKLEKYFDDPDKIVKLVKSGNEAVQKILTLLKDEVRMFILFHTMYIRVSLCTPQQLQYLDSAAYAKLVIFAVLSFVTGGATIYARTGAMVLDASSLTSSVAD